MAIKIIPKKKELVEVVGEVQVQHKNKAQKEKKIKVKEQVVEGQMANVGVSLAYTKNMGNYESCKVTVSLFMPSKETEIDKTFESVKTWVDVQLGKVLEEVEQGK